MAVAPTYDPLNPFPMYRYMRETNPVFRNPATGMWQVFRYDDAIQVINVPTVFSSDIFGNSPNKMPMAESLVHIDPPRHRQLRSLVTLAFTPKRVAQLEQRIVAIAHELLNRVVSSGTMDFIDDFASPLPVIVIAELLGIPSEDRANFHRWSDDLVASPLTGTAYRQPEMYDYLQSVIEQQRKAPADDLISTLIEAQVDGQRLSEREILGFCVLLLVAGNETTINLLGNTLLCFDEHPDVPEQLRNDLSLLPEAIEEVLRYRSPVQWLARIASVDTIIGGHQIPAGESITVSIGSANRDEAQFVHPEVFDIRRTPNRHIAFGHGIHFCLGAPLARLEARIAISVLLERLSDISLAKTAPLEPVSQGFYGVRHLPLHFRS